MADPLTDGADDAGVPGRDWLLVDVQQTEVLQEGVGHAGVQPLPLDEGVWQGHVVRVAPQTSCCRRRVRDERSQRSLMH